MGLLNFLITNLWLVAIIAIVLVVGISCFNKKLLIPAMIIYVAGILYLIIFNRIGMLISVNVSFFASLKCLLYPGTIDTIIENIILFIPLGAILYKLKPKWAITLVGVGQLAGHCDWVCGDEVADVKNDEQMFLILPFSFAII